MPVWPLLQQRLRQVTGAKGGPPVEADESMQPTYMLGGYFDRLPQFELGETIPRTFVAIGSRSNVAAEQGGIAIRNNDERSLVRIRRITLVANVELEFNVGRATIAPAAAWTNLGNATYNDFRLPSVNLQTATGANAQVDVGGFNATAAGHVGGFYVCRVTNNAGGHPTGIIECDFILWPRTVLVSGFTQDCILAKAGTANVSVSASFDGEIYPLESEIRNLVT